VEQGGPKQLFQAKEVVSQPAGKGIIARETK
jgi:hypothetical protein